MSFNNELCNFLNGLTIISFETLEDNFSKNLQFLKPKLKDLIIREFEKSKSFAKICEKISHFMYILFLPLYKIPFEKKL